MRNLKIDYCLILRSQSPTLLMSKDLYILHQRKYLIMLNICVLIYTCYFHKRLLSTFPPICQTKSGRIIPAKSTSQCPSSNAPRKRTVAVKTGVQDVVEMNILQRVEGEKGDESESAPRHVVHDYGSNRLSSFRDGIVPHRMLLQWYSDVLLFRNLQDNGNPLKWPWRNTHPVGGKRTSFEGGEKDGACWIRGERRFLSMPKAFTV